MRYLRFFLWALLLFSLPAAGSEHQRFRKQGFAALDSGNFARARVLFQKAYAEADVALLRQQMDLTLAVCEVLDNKPDEAMRYLNRAVADGVISKDDVENEEVYEPLRNRPDYKDLIGRMDEQARVQAPVFFLGLYQGALWMIALFTLLLWMGTRERAYVWLCLSVLWWIQFHLYQKEGLGTFYSELFPLAWWVKLSKGQFLFTVGFFMASHFLFLRRFLGIQKGTRVNTLMVALCIFYPLTPILTRLFPHTFWILTRQEFYVVGIILGCTLVFQSYRKGLPGSGAFLLSYGFFMSGSILSLVYSRSQSGFPRGPGISDLTWVETGGLLFFSAQALAVGLRMAQLRREREKAMEDAMKHLEQKVQERTFDLNKAKETVEHQHQEILDSIEYAQRIQQAILPSESMTKAELPDSFILYIPKDLVAGDFYWMERKGPWLWFAVCDCTGHGVPGAMVSVVCHNALNRAVNEFGCIMPGEILDKVAELVLDNFSNDQDVKDGMDASLCAWNQETQTLYWCGANNPLWVIGKDGLLAWKPNKQAIGQVDNRVLYTTHTVSLNKGDFIYLFSDGFADQFGGEKGKKLTRLRFQEWLLEVVPLPPSQQRKKLMEQFETYRGNLPQVDDVCVLGVKLLRE